MLAAPWVEDSRLLSVGGKTPAGFNSDGPEPVLGTFVGGAISAVRRGDKWRMK